MTLVQLRDKIINDRKLIYDSYVERDFSFQEMKGMATVIVGARRVGKSSLMRMFARSLVEKGLPEEKICYLSFFGMEEEKIFFSMIESAYYTLYPDYENDKDVWFLLDEIQNVSFWGEGISVLMDYHKCHVVVTGSSAKYLSTDIATELRGRSLTYRFYPLSFREFCRFNSYNAESALGYDSPARNKLSGLYRKYFEQGSYPALSLVENPEMRKMVLNTYFDLAYSRDIIDRFEVTKGTMLKVLMKRLVKNSGQPFTINSLTHYLKSVGFNTSNELVTSYVNMIKDTCFFTEVKFFGTEKQQEVNPRKLYTVDHTMAVLFREFDKNTGVKLEHAVLMDLIRMGKDVYYYRNQNGIETDFVVADEDRKPTMLIQVSDSVAENRQRELAGCISAMKDLSLDKAFIVTNDEFFTEENKVAEGTIYVVPAWRFSLNIKRYFSL